MVDLVATGRPILRFGKKMKAVIGMKPLRFVIVGIFNTVIGLAIIFAAKALFSFGDLPSNVLGYGVGLLVSFFLNRNWTFQYNGKVLPACLRFGIAVALAYSLNLATVFGLRDGAGINSYLSQAAGVIPYTVFFYLASRYYVFSERDTA